MPIKATQKLPPHLVARQNRHEYCDDHVRCSGSPPSRKSQSGPVPPVPVRVQHEVRILNCHRTDASNGPTQGPPGHQEGQESRPPLPRFGHYRLRCLLHVGGVTWPSHP